jgi:diguanylate cyclase (GGDEF)-like protein/PAS domain S-box-containing protein
MLVNHAGLLRDIDAADLNDNLPVGVLVVDDIGVIHHANRRAAELTGFGPDEAVGRSILDFVDHNDLGFLMASFTAAPEYAGEVMGPARLRYRSSDGAIKWTEYWSYRCPPSFGFEGYIVTLSMESVTDNLANAAFQIASDEPLEVALESIARAVTGHPIIATGSILVPEGDDIDVIGSWPFGDRVHVDDPTMPWHEVLVDGTSLDFDVESLPEPLRTDAITAGYRSVWIRGVVTQGAVVAGVFVAWRREPGTSSPNQERHLAEVVGVARLAFDHDEHRRQLERAALSDYLTGVGNRALLTRNLAAADHARIAVLYIDLDGFKSVNDTHGHDVGDMLLTATAQRIRAVVRDDDNVFRIGGDEFVVLCHGIEPGDSPATPRDMADRIISSLRAPFQIASTSIQVGASIGIATRNAGDATSDVIRRADQALMTAKREGKSRWSLAPSIPALDA